MRNGDYSPSSRVLRSFLVAAMLWSASACPALAAPLARDAVPEPLRPWIDWVLRGHEEELCPRLYGNADAHRCAWPSRLTLDLDEHGGRFSQQWTIAREEWIVLPGHAASWPHDVTIDGKPATVGIDLSAVGPDGGVPRLRASAGEHTIAGRFEWRGLPEKLRIPPATGLLSLNVDGRPVTSPDRDRDGNLWLQRRAAADEAVSQLNVSVHRLVIDDIPLQLLTRIELTVSGPGREVLLGRALPDGFVPMAFDTPIPARLEADNRLRVQVRTGRWQLELRARHEGPVAAVMLQEPQGDWDTDEIWVFQARPHLRVVTVAGADGIDPQQTDLPADWRQLPAYIMRPGTTMKLVEQRRGDTDPAADELNLDRTLWLDFDGGGYTVHDRLRGTLRRSWRLEMLSPIELGRVAVAGQDQFVTRLADRAAVGVEIRQGSLQVEADARLAGNVRGIPAVGWDLDFNSVSGTLNLPPGWRLLHATGVDLASPTWVTSWTLFDFFVVLIIVLAIARLWSALWAALALLALGLTFNEPDAPQFTWLALLAAEGLIRVLPAGRLLNLLRFGRIVALAALAITAVPFMLQQARQGLYPALEYPWAALDVSRAVSARSPESEAPADSGEGRARSDDLRSVKRPAPQMIDSGYVAQRYQALIDPKAVVQTGPGLPAWAWNQVTLRWQGPVERQQQLHLYLVHPWASALLAAARVLFVALLLTRVVPRAPFGDRALHVALAALVLVPFTRAATAAETPPTALFDELRARLLAPPDCHPYCATIPRMRLEILPDALRARVEAHAIADGAIPLPGHASQWLAHTILVDDHAAAAVSQMDDTLWVHLSAGVHQILLEGPLPRRDTIQVALPLRPQRVDVQTDGWEVDGVHENGIVDDNLQLTRLAPQEATRAALKPGALPPFVSIERTILLPLSWRVETRIVRLTPPGTAIVIDVPLLAGESVTTPGVRVVDGKVSVNLPAQSMASQWESTLTEISPIRLQAADVTTWSERWVVDTSPIWHVETDGIPVVHQPAAGTARLREWRPWPGEQVTLHVTRPEGMAGQTLTIDLSVVEVMPGIRATDVTTTVDLRSNRGAQHTITLPENAQLQSVSLNGTDQPIRQEGRSVTVPIVPGRQTLALNWRQSDGIQRRFTTPDIDLGAPNVNVDLRVAFPADRWILFVRGPRLGPAVLFWSSLIVLLLIAVGLDRVRVTPLRTHHWFLLGVGLTQVPVQAAAVVVAWLLVLGWRRRFPLRTNGVIFDLVQLTLIAWTLAALAALLWAIQQGLLGLPEMQITGNGSSAASLRWYQDRSAGQLPHASVLSVPLLVYRMLMLTWALWIAQALLGWLRWAWECFSAGGYWRPLRQPRPTP